MSRPPRALHSMAVVARRTGLSPAVVRAWERRHGAIAPSRSDGNQRLYSEEQVQRLQVLQQAVAAGWKIGRVALLPDAEVRALLRDVRPAHPPEAARSAAGPGRLRSACMEDVASLDGAHLAARLEEAAVELGRVALVDGLLVPLMQRIGDACASGALRIANEHLASSVVASFLGGLRPAFEPPGDAPVLVVATPAFQHHALGALLVAATGRMEGWQTVHLGANVPAEEIAAAARQRRARAVALSISFARSDPRLDDELRRLGRMLSGAADLLVGGAASQAHAVLLDEIGARLLADLASLRGYLQAGR
jgi:DNA-binding transcriptional MerR regulator/methylmalonyl-CoA mutase cobalamin-binding subunit